MVREGTEASAISAAHSCPTAAPSTPLDCTAGVCQQSYLGGGLPLHLPTQDQPRCQPLFASVYCSKAGKWPAQLLSRAPAISQPRLQTLSLYT